MNSILKPLNVAGVIMAGKKTKTKQQRKKKQPPVQQNRWGFLIWFVLIWILLYQYGGFFGKKDSVSIPYSSFKTQVEKGNVKEITLKGDKISGKFDKAIRVPPDTAKADTFLAFSTFKPNIQDPGLMKALEAKRQRFSRAFRSS